MIRLFVGLGNPGSEYRDTRHNAGFWFIDALAAQWKCLLALDKAYHGLVCRSAQNGQNVWLLQPQTFMNASGKSVAALARFFKIAPEEILVAYDELDLSPGQAKLKLGGSSTHNGLRDITTQLGANYWRLRLGIGHPGHKSEVVAWVLQKPSSEQRGLIDQAIQRCLQAVPYFFSGDMDKATQVIHTTQAPRPKPAKPLVSAQTVPTATAAGDANSAG